MNHKHLKHLCWKRIYLLAYFMSRNFSRRRNPTEKVLQRNYITGYEKKEQKPSFNNFYSVMHGIFQRTCERFTFVLYSQLPKGSFLQAIVFLSYALLLIKHSAHASAQKSFHLEEWMSLRINFLCFNEKKKDEKNYFAAFCSSEDEMLTKSW